MSEQSIGSMPGNVITDEAALPHAEVIASTIRNLMDYGPLKVVTRVPGIPGVRYREAVRRDENQDPNAFIGSTALSVIADEAGVRAEVQADEETEPFILTPDQIEDVYIDHPHGRSMPLHGNDMMAISLTKRDGVAVLRWPDHVIEYGYHDRIDVSNHPDYPGITVVRCYRADDENIMNDGPPKIAPLEAAKEKDDQPRTFLITRVNDDTYVVTSRIGYEETTPVTVRKPRHPGTEPLLHVEMIDMHKDTADQELVDTHIKRYREVSQDYLGSPRWSMTPFEADSIFLYMVND